MRDPEVQRAIGARMKRAAQDAGLTAYAVADTLRVRPPTVYRWWAGAHGPPAATMQSYAALVGRPLSFFYEDTPGEPVGAQQPESSSAEEFADWVLRFTDRLMAGEPPGDAIEAVAGHAVEPERRARLNQRAAALRQYLLEMLGRPWNDLTTEEKRATVDRLIRELDEQPPQG